MTKRAEKVSGLLFILKREGKCEINLKKKKIFIMSFLGAFLTIFGR